MDDGFSAKKIRPEKARRYVTKLVEAFDKKGISFNREKVYEELLEIVEVNYYWVVGKVKDAIKRHGYWKNANLRTNL